MARARGIYAPRSFVFGSMPHPQEVELPRRRAKGFLRRAIDISWDRR